MTRGMTYPVQFRRPGNGGVVLALLAGIATGLSAVADAAQTTERASVSSAGAQGDATSGSFPSSVSADGNVISFSSAAGNLVPDDTNGVTDVFVRDRSAGVTRRVNISSIGEQANAHSSDGMVSAEGDHVLFCSPASNLVPDDTNGRWDAFVHTISSGQTVRVSVATGGSESHGGDAECGFISSDGRYAAFLSNASDLVPSDSNNWPDVFVHDLQTQTTTRVNVSSSGDQANGFSGVPTIAAGGRYVAFSSAATNLVPGDTNNRFDVFIHDTVLHLTRRISVSSAGVEANGFSALGNSANNMSADGRYVVFNSIASNLVAADNNGAQDAFVHDVVSGTTERINLSTAGAEADSYSFSYSMSADGRFIAFVSNASNLVSDDANNETDVFVRDRIAGTTTRWSLTASGSEANGGSYNPQISGDGSLVAFDSVASNLVAGDTNDAMDVFVRGPGGNTPLYTFIGFNAPVENLPLTNAAKAGSAVPVKWQLTDGDGNFVSDLSVVQSLQYAATACDAQDFDLAVPIEAYASGGSGLQYDAATNEFVYPWKTAKSQKGTCAVFGLTLTDGQQHFARFLLK